MDFTCNSKHELELDLWEFEKFRKENLQTRKEKTMKHDNPSNSTKKLLLLNVEALLQTIIDYVREQQRQDMVKLLSLEVGSQALTMLQVTSGTTTVWHQVLMICTDAPHCNKSCVVLH